MEQREILIQIKVEARRNTLCTRKGYAASVSRLRRQRLRYISRDSKRRGGSKDPLGRGKAIQEYAKLKRERGEWFIHPAVAPVSLCERFVHCGQIPLRNLHLGGQNLAALCTAAGQNLTAVGSSHSLTETVDLGTMTTAGLIGTLHYITPPVNSMMLNSRFPDRSET